MNRSSTWISLGISVALIAAGILFLSYWGYGPINGLRGAWPMWQSGHGNMMAYGGTWGMGSGMGIGMLLFWVLIILALVSLIAGAFTRTGRARGPKGPSDDALEILKKRYARGEIDKTEFEAKRRDLMDAFGKGL